MNIRFEDGDKTIEILGIFEWKADDLRMCLMNVPGAARPKAFAPTDDNLVATFKRIKP